MELPQKGFSMAEYIWIDGHGGVRSKTKVRVLVTATRPYDPHTASMHTLCTILQPFAPAQNMSWCHRSALIGRADSKISLGAELNASTIRARSATSVLTPVLILATV